MVFPQLSYDIDAKAFDIFRDWVRVVKGKYPAWELVLEDEREIVKSFKGSVMEGLQRIGEREPNHRNLLDWCTGYLKGFVSSGLSFEWNRRYVQFQSEGYKHALWLKSLILFLGVDSDALKRVNRLYRYLLENNFPFQDLPNTETEEELMGRQVLADFECQQNWGFHKPYMEDLLYQDFLKTLDKAEQLEVPDLDEYFSLEEMEEIILKSPFDSDRNAA